MFSYFENGITGTTCNRFIDLYHLVNIIKNHQNAVLIDEIRTLRSMDDDNYKKLKKQLPYITPNCMVQKRSLGGDNFKTNFIQSSGYIYIDLDVGCETSRDYKSYFIDKYGHRATLVCLSSSAGGISVLFRVKTLVTKENFDYLWNYIKDNILAGEPVDLRSKDIGRAMFVSHDPNVYINYENDIDIQLTEPSIIPIEKKVKQSNSSKGFTNTLNSPFSVLSIDKVYEKLVVSTRVEILNPIVDFRPVECTEVFIPKVIKDGTKHTIYPSMIHNLVYLNPDIEREYIFSFLFYINNRFARPRMDKKELFRLFNLVFDGIKKTGKSYHSHYIKFVHINPKISISKKEKIQIANTLNGYQRRNLSYKKIQDAIRDLEQSGQKVTPTRIAELSGLTPKTVRARLKSGLIDMDEKVKMINDSIFINDCVEETDNRTSTTGNDFKQVFTARKDKDPLNVVAVPDCKKLIRTVDSDNLKMDLSLLNFP